MGLWVTEFNEECDIPLKFGVEINTIQYKRR